MSGSVRIIHRGAEGGVKMAGLMFMDAPYQDGQGWYAGYVLGGPQIPGPSGFLPPTRTVKDELKTTIAGVELDLIHACRRVARCHRRLAAAKASAA